MRDITTRVKFQWSFFKAAYDWHQRNSSLPTHERLTEEHSVLGYASKMRNHLATDMLNKRMLFLMNVQSNSIINAKFALRLAWS